MRPPTSLRTSSASERFNLPDLNVTAGVYSVRGANRSNNEDYQYVSPDCSVFIVADGMGGHQAGEFASRFVVDALTHEFEHTFDDTVSNETVEEHIHAAFEHANCLLLEATEDSPDYTGAGSTALLALVFGTRLFISGIGDSRAYLLQGDTFEQLTQDDSIPGYLHKAGLMSAEQAKRHPMRNRLSSFMGMGQFQPDEDIRIIHLQHESVVLLCSDGLTDVVDDITIKAVLQSHSNPQLAARQLVQTAVENKAKDDVTCVVFHVEQDRSMDVVETTGRFTAFVESVRSLFGQRPMPAV